MRYGVILLPSLAACAPQPSLPDGALVGGDNAHLFEQHGATLRCPAGSQLVEYPAGHTSCAHTSASAVRTTSTIDKAMVDQMAAESRLTGQAVAATDGIYTVTVTGTQ